jgi:hypothetical protein
MEFVIHLGNNEKSGFLHDLKASHKCSESSKELQDGGGSIWCAMQRKKYWRLDEKVEQLGEGYMMGEAQFGVRCKGKNIEG